MWTRKTNISGGKNRHFCLLTHYHLYRWNPNCSCALRCGRYPHFCRSRYGTYINLAVGIYIYVAVCTHIPVVVGTCICVALGTQISVAIGVYICEAVRRPTCNLCGNFFPTFHDHRHATICRTLLDEWSARRRNLYLTTHNAHKRQTSMLPARLEPTVPGSEWPQTHALDRAATGIGMYVALVTHNYVALCTYICVDLVISSCLGVGVYIGMVVGICVYRSSYWWGSSYLPYISI